MTSPPDWRARLGRPLLLALLAAPLVVLAALVLLTSSMVGSAAAQRTDGAFTSAEEYLARGDGVAAEIQLKAALADGAALQDIAALMGEAEMLQGDLAEARRWLGPGEFSADFRARGFQALGRLELAEGNLPQAGWAFDQSYAANPDSAPLWVDIARLRYRGGEHGGAREAIDRALALDPNHPRALEFRGLITREANGPRPALQWFERGLAVAPQDIGLMAEYAATLGELGRPTDMLAAIRQISELAPDDPRSGYLQATLAARAGQNGLGRRLLWRSDEEQEHAPAHRLILGALELQAGNPATALESLGELLRQQPDNRSARRLHARALLENGEARELISRYAANALRPDSDPYLMMLIGRAHEQLGNRAKAAIYLDRAAGAERPFVANLSPGSNIGSLRSAWEADRRSVPAGIAFIRGLVAEREFSRATAVAQSLARTYPDSADVASIAGDATLAEKRFDLAIRYYAQAAKTREPDALAVRMAAAMIDLRRFDQAEAFLVNHLRNTGPDQSVAELLALIAVQRQDWQAAHEWLAYANAVPGADRDPALLRWRAEMLLRLARPDDALPVIGQAYALQPANPEIARTYAEILSQSGDAHAANAKAMFAKSQRMAAIGR